MANNRASYMDGFSTNRLMIYSNQALVGTAMSFEASIVMDSRAIYGMKAQSTPLCISQGARRLHGSMDLAVIEGDGVMDLVPDNYFMYPPLLEGMTATRKSTDGDLLKGDEILSSDELGDIIDNNPTTDGSLGGVNVGIGGSNTANFGRDPGVFEEVANSFLTSDSVSISSARPVYADQMSNIRLQMFINKQDGRMWTRSVSGITPTRHNISMSMENLFNESMQFLFIAISNFDEMVTSAGDSLGGFTGEKGTQDVSFQNALAGKPNADGNIEV